MEHIGEALGNLDRGNPTLNQINIAPEKVLIPEEKREELRKALGVSSMENTFENFKPVPGTRKALTAFKELAAGKTRRKMLLCYGGVGNGKTHLCEAATIALCKRGLFCRVITMAWIMGVLRSAIREETVAPYQELLSRYCRAPRLVIDDVGMGGSGSDWEYGQLEEIVAHRYRERLFTILTTNRDISELPERIVSRFRDPDVGMVVLNEGADYRRLKGGSHR